MGLIKEMQKEEAVAYPKGHRTRNCERFLTLPSPHRTHLYCAGLSSGGYSNIDVGCAVVLIIQYSKDHPKDFVAHGHQRPYARGCSG
jgi:hypothetical protein